MSENCDKHSCGDCLMFDWDRFNRPYEECPCYLCSHGWRRGNDNAECKHVKEWDSTRIERNKRFISKNKHVMDVVKNDS